MIIYHIAQKNDWSEALETGFFRCESLEKEGFIHCSTAEQIIPVANRFYKDLKDLVLLYIEQELVSNEIRYENLEGGEDQFPHIYGKLNLDAVSKSIAFSSNREGIFEFPD